MLDIDPKCVCVCQGQYLSKQNALRELPLPNITKVRQSLPESAGEALRCFPLQNASSRLSIGVGVPWLR